MLALCQIMLHYANYYAYACTYKYAGKLCRHNPPVRSVYITKSIKSYKIQRMRHQYIHFPPNGPLDDRNRSIGMCECGAWKDDSPSEDPCPNAVAANQGKLYFSPS